jgi:hypothetical protein
MLASLERHRDAEIVIVDVRGNGGGSSYWSEPFIRHLYGEAFWEWLRHERLRQRASLYVEHRVSADNLAHFESLLPRVIEQAGEGSEMHRFLLQLIEGIRTALENGEALFRVDAGAAAVEGGPPAAEPAFVGRLIYLTDGICVSACLDFTDVVMMLPRAIHAGQPTSSDTPYMEVRAVPLPSNLAVLNFATKVYRGARRDAAGYYTPQFLYAGDIRDTTRLETWLAETVLGPGGDRRQDSERLEGDRRPR